MNAFLVFKILSVVVEVVFLIAVFNDANGLVLDLVGAYLVLTAILTLATVWGM